MGHDMLACGIPYAEKALRTIAVYALVLLLLRLAGKRELAQLNTFDLAVMLLLSNVVQNAIIGPDVSVSGAAFGAVVLVSVNAVFVRLSARYRWLRKLLVGSATVLARDGRWLPLPSDGRECGPRTWRSPSGGRAVTASSTRRRWCWSPAGPWSSR